MIKGHSRDGWTGTTTALLEKSVLLPICRPSIPRSLSWYETRNSAVTDQRPTAWSFVYVVGVCCRVLTLDYQLQSRVMTQRHATGDRWMIKGHSRDDWTGTTIALQEKTVLLPICRPSIPRGLSWYETRNSAVTDQRPTAWSFVHVVGVWCRVLTLDYQLQSRVMTQRHLVTGYPVTLRHVPHERSLRVTVILTLRLTIVGVGVNFNVSFESHTLLDFPFRSATFAVQNHLKESATEHTSLSWCFTAVYLMHVPFQMICTSSYVA
jgi:hypothetical protein